MAGVVVSTIINAHGSRYSSGFQGNLCFFSGENAFSPTAGSLGSSAIVKVSGQDGAPFRRIPSGFPTGFPTWFPTGFPTGFPTL